MTRKAKQPSRSILSKFCDLFRKQEQAQLEIRVYDCELGRRVNEGHMTVLCVIGYDFHDDCLLLAFPTGVDKEEGRAILSKFSIATTEKL